MSKDSGTAHICANSSAEVWFVVFCCRQVGGKGHVTPRGLSFHLSVLPPCGEGRKTSLPCVLAPISS
jgi:hypothetical protein